ncbi:MAG: histidine kinase, partial [Spirosoma sp.]|nr:histidine kinase [Spirosoma sp.]
MKRIERHLFLVLAIVSVCLSTFCYVVLERNAPNATDEQYVNTVQERVKAIMGVSTRELHDVASLLKRTTNPTFAELNVKTQHPYYVFKDSALVFWSDYRFIPAYGQIAARTSPRLVDFEQGRYVVSHERVVRIDGTWDVFSLVNVFRSYPQNNAFLQSGYNTLLFALDPAAISQQPQSAYQAITDNKGVFLFSVMPPRLNAYRNHSTPVNTVFWASLGTLFLGFYVLQLISQLRRKREYEWAFGWLASYLIVMRAVMLYFGVPFLFIETDLFNPKFYYLSILGPSLGDLLLNALVVAVLALYWVRYYYRSRSYTYLLHRPQRVRTVLSVGFVVLSYVVFGRCYTELNHIYEKSPFTLDITLNIRFSLLKIASLVLIVAIAIIYFLVMHLLGSLFVRYNRAESTSRGLLLILMGTVIAVGLLALLGWRLNGLLLLHGGYFFFIYVGGLPKTLYTFRYKTSIYLFMAAFFFAVTTAYVVYSQEVRKQLVYKREFGKQLLAENDELGEFLLNKARQTIARDAEIARLLQIDTLLVRERIQQRVKVLHLDKYIGKYDVGVSSFRNTGRPLDLNPNAATLISLGNRYRRPAFQTQYPGVYLIREGENQVVKQYICFVTVQRPVFRPIQIPTAARIDTVGYVVLDLRLRSEGPASGYPDLLIDTKFSQNPDAREYSYAVYSSERSYVPAPAIPAATSSAGVVGPTGNSTLRLLYSTGTYNYERKLPPSMLANASLFGEGLSSNDFLHVAQRGRDGRLVVVSSAEYPYRSIFSNFSFVFLLLVLTVVLGIIANAIEYGFLQFSINYSTRIQILLNVAFFMPLLLVIVIILSVIGSNNITNQENDYISNTRNIAANFLTYLEEHMQAKKRSKASLDEELSKTARDAGIDINLFDAQGQLYTSTHPLMYESNYLSKRINPEAYIRIAEDKENQILLNESLGNRQYRTAYAGIKSYDGRLLGILSIPYFYARSELDRQIIDVFAPALSIFTALFLFFLVLSYFASNVLTKPLRLLTQKIRKTNLDRPNDPLPWNSDDEIGLLIREYNRMLVKLEDSRRALTRNEKQSAWREMAKQVAHEIKNPLTPMKLTLQHLQRTLPTSHGADGILGGNDEQARRQVIKRTFDSLLDQIDN